jgi:hypothetical protein
MFLIALSASLGLTTIPVFPLAGIAASDFGKESKMIHSGS